ncbi:Hypothetical predicted protein [Cloeon dipterum]|uniref:Uncharacterized protein n=1 Tax=Cloeon dipterum TaxID=197152 RepID=A0A8S1CNM5_9INSE|nr:Hypothetical predicted protein [Cloeon dipterum]
MKLLVVLCAVLAVTSAAGIHDALVAKWSPTVADDSLYSIPTTKGGLDNDAISWVQVPGDAGDPFTIHCENDNERYCVLFDLNGFIAGEQYSIPDEDIANVSGNYSFENVPSFRRTTRFGRNVWTGTAFFVSPTVLDNGGRTDLSEGTIVELWVQKGDSYKTAEQIPLDRFDLEANTNYLLCNCVPGMGIHYYTEMYQAGSCDKFDPWFLMYTGFHMYTAVRVDGNCNDFEPWFLLYVGLDFVGLGFQSFGRAQVRPNIRHYDENIPLDDFLFIVPSAPKCFTDLYAGDGAISLRTFFVSDPLADNWCPEI